MNQFRSVCPEVVGLGGGGAPAYTAASVVFDGLNGRIAFTGSSVVMNGTGTEFAMSVWVRPAQTAAPRNIIFSRNSAGGAYWELQHSSAAPWSFRNAASTVVVAGTSSTSILTVNNWYHILFSFNTTSTSLRHIWINGVDRGAGGGAGWSVYTIGGQPALDRNEFYIGNNDGFDGDYNGHIAELWVDDIYRDWSVQTNREKFCLAGLPQDLGSDGSAPFGVAPDLYMRFLSGALAVNSGADTATGTINGTVVSGGTTVSY